MRPWRIRVFPLIGAVAMCTSIGNAADEQPQDQCTGAEIAALMEKTNIDNVMNYSGLPSEYKSDGDMDTLEFVFLPKRKGVTSTVSEDGEVIFLVGNVKDAEQQRLIIAAFCRKVVARRA